MSAVRRLDPAVAPRRHVKNLVSVHSNRHSQGTNVLPRMRAVESPNDVRLMGSVGLRAVAVCRPQKGVAKANRASRADAVPPLKVILKRDAFGVSKVVVIRKTVKLLGYAAHIQRC